MILPVSFMQYIAACRLQGCNCKCCPFPDWMSCIDDQTWLLFFLNVNLCCVRFCVPCCMSLDFVLLGLVLVK